MPADAPVPEAIVEDKGEAPNWLGCELEIPGQPNCVTRRYQSPARSAADGRASVLVQSHSPRLMQEDFRGPPMRQTPVPSNNRRRTVQAVLALAFAGSALLLATPTVLR